MRRACRRPADADAPLLRHAVRIYLRAPRLASTAPPIYASRFVDFDLVVPAFDQQIDSARRPAQRFVPPRHIARDAVPLRSRDSAADLPDARTPVADRIAIAPLGRIAIPGSHLTAVIDPIAVDRTVLDAVGNRSFDQRLDPDPSLRNPGDRIALHGFDSCRLANLPENSMSLAEAHAVVAPHLSVLHSCP